MDNSIFTSTFQASIYELMLNLLDKYSESGSLASLFGLPSSTGNVYVDGAGGESEFSALIKQAAEKYGVNENLVEAVIQTESNYDPFAVSPAGAEGLMQLMPATAENLGVINSLDPAQNINGGTKLLRSLLDRYDGNVTLALAAYNAGPGAVDEYDGVPPYTETQTYVQRVMQYFRANLAEEG